MNREEAIDCVQDLIDVANNRGSAYVYKHNGGVDRLQNVLDALKNPAPAPRAHWVYNPNANDWGIGGWCCSHCRFKNDAIGISQKPAFPIRMIAGTKFCGNCGRRMTEEE